jgi:PKD repeat protein
MQKKINDSSKFFNFRNALLFVIVITLFLGNFSYCTVANSDETHKLNESIIEKIAVNKLTDGKIEQSIRYLIDKSERFNNLKIERISDFNFISDKVQLEIILSNENEIDTLQNFNEDIEIQAFYKSLVQILVPIDIIEQLAEQEFVRFIRKPMELKPQVISEGVGVIGADDIHSEGFYGDGVKVAIIDTGFEDYDINPDIPSERIIEAISYRAGHGIEYGGPHGSACTELVLDVAPYADLYLYSCATVSEMNNAFDRAISQNVDIISFSLGIKNVNFYDGAGEWCDIINNARSQGILVVVAAGNEADHHYQGWYNNLAGYDFHDFGGGDVFLDIGWLFMGDPYWIDLTWDDWLYSNQDYDLILWAWYAEEIVDFSFNPQTGTQPPTEWMAGTIPYYDYYCIAISRYSATRDVYLELYGEYNSFLEYNHPESSLTCPADATGAMTSGATYWLDDNLEEYSSRGPTNDGRTKPDVTAPDYVSTWTYGHEGFPGTSASCPHTAGAAALLKSADFSLTADDLQTKLESTALDLGPGGKDNSYGSGRIDVWAAFCTINQPPNANFTYSPLNPTTLDVIQFTDASTDDGTIVSWNWDFGDGGSSSSQNPTHQYGDDGTYIVSLTITDDGGKTDDYEDNITVGNNPPTAYIDSIDPNPAILGELVYFDGYGDDSDGYITGYNWRSDLDGQLSTQSSFSIPSLSSGTHTIYFKVKDDDDEWSEEDALSLLINIPPVANFTYEPSTPTTQNIIYFNSTSYDPDGSIINWTWDFGSGDFAYEEFVTYQYEEDGTYAVTVIVTDDNGAVNIFLDDVDVSNVPPNANFTYSPPNPTTLDVIQFTDLSTDVDGTVVSWLWDFGDGNTSTLQNPTHQYSDDDTYNVKLNITDDDGATDVSEGYIYVGAVPPNANFTYTPSVSTPLEIIQFTDTSIDLDGTIVSWYWEFGDGNTSPEQNPSYSYSNWGMYTINLTVTDDDDLTDKISRGVHVNGLPIASFYFDPTSPYVNEPISFSDQSIDPYGPIIIWFWDFGDGNTSTQQNPTHQYVEDGVYLVTLNVTDEYGATNQTSQLITVLNVKPTPMFTYSPEFPTDLEDVIFTDMSIDPDGYIVSWYWNFGDGNTSSDQNPIHQYADDGIYTITLNVTDDDGATNETIGQVTIKNVPPTADFNYVPLLSSINEIIQFTDTSTDLDGTIVSWYWTFGDGNTSILKNPQHSFSSCETYVVTLNVTDDDGDTDEASLQIITKIVFEIETNPGINEIDLKNEADTTIVINVTSPTNITVESYSGNPTQENITHNITSIGNYINIEVENESSIVWPIDIRIYYTQEDLNSSEINESQLFGIYFWNGTENEWKLYSDTGVNTMYNQSGYEGYCWANAWHLTPLTMGGDTELPLQVTGLTVSDAKDGKLDLTWDAAIDNVAIAYYNIYRDSTTIPLTTVQHPTTTYQDTGLSNGQSYSYYISAVDTSGNEGEKSDPKSSTPTASDTGGNGGNGGGGGGLPPGPMNQNPIADASSGEPYYGFADSEITFDGSNSYDPDDDGYIDSWNWDFGDGTNGTGEIVNHIYSNQGTYNVVLTVVDNEGAEDTYATTAVISQPNIPPFDPIVNGTQIGEKDTTYRYTAVSADPENDTIRYFINWDDGTNTTSDFLTNGTAFNATHSWLAAGIYLVTVYAMDENNATSGTTELLVLVDVNYCGDLGYLIDSDSNDIYDLFYCNETGEQTVVEQKDGSYLIDSDGDGKWDYIFDFAEGITTYQKEEDEEKKGTPGFELILILFSVAVTLFWKRKRLS